VPNARHNQKHTGRTTRPGSRDIAPLGSSQLARASRPSSAESLRILWYSNAPFAPTGYGTQTAQVVQRLTKNHEVAIHAMYGIEGVSSVWNGIKLYPRGMSPYSDDVLVAHWMDWANGNRDIAAMLMTLFDVWVLKSPSLDQVPNIASWVPIDHAPCPPEVVSWCKRPNVKPIAMSKFGLDMLQNAGVDAMYAPHAFEDVFVPTPKLSNGRGEFTGRQLMEVDEDRFVVMMNAANKGQNPSRKSFGENILSFAIFAQNRPDALLYLHTERDGAMGGINLVHLLEACGVKKEQYKIVDPYTYRTGFPQQALAALYTASDVLLACSMGEGFGIPVIEAQACGTRVIVSDYTAQPELVGAGWAVDIQPFWDSHQKSWFCTPQVPSIVNALIEAYEAPRGVCDEAVAFADQYRADTVFETHWKPIMKELSEWCQSSSSPS
jgi:glycosyltransferase involved in cell wall biosynthesis